MKNLTIILTLIISLLISGCDDLLKEEIRGQVSNSDYWKTEQDAETAIKAAYGTIRGGWVGLSLWQFVVEDMGTNIATGGYFSTENYTNYTGWSGTNPDFISWGIWPGFWEGINYANSVLDNVPAMDIDEEVKNRILGEAHAIRAMIYFYMVNWFGGMPEVTTTKEVPLEIPRQSVEGNYQLIESDLLTAAELLPAKSDLVDMGETDYGRLTKHAALSLLARAYLQQKKWQDCADASQEIINSNEYKLETEYMDIFSMANEGFQNDEVIWVQPFIAGSSPVVPGVVLQVYLWRAPENTDYAAYYEWNGDIRSTTSFYNSFEAGDKRKDGLLRSTDATTDPIMMIKYPPDPSTDGQYSGSDYPFIRYADIILMKAEALAQLDRIDESITEINTVRDRAAIPAINATDFIKETLLDHILSERLHEFYFEGHAKRDYIRLNYDGMIEYIKSQSSDWELFSAERYLLLPLPTNALAANPGLTQNPGF